MEHCVNRDRLTIGKQPDSLDSGKAEQNPFCSGLHSMEF